MTTFNDVFNITTPAGSDSPNEADDRMREIKAATQERENVDHYWPLTGTEVSDADAGEHRKVLFHEPIAATPTVAADHGDLRIKDVANGSDTLAELVFTNESEEELQLSSSGNNLANDTFLTGTNAAGTGSVNLIKAGTNDLSTLPDGAEMATNAAPTEDEGVANKKYVDDEVADKTGGDAATTNDSESNAFLKSHAYLTQTAGFVSAYITANTNTTLEGFIDDSTDPAGSGQKVGRADGGAAAIQPWVYFYVPNGQYFEITTDVSDASLDIFWTPLETGGAAPIDQD